MDGGTGREGEGAEREGLESGGARSGSNAKSNCNAKTLFMTMLSSSSPSSSSFPL
jgi:hypothetical protein